MPDPKNITEATTLGDLREQLLLLDVVALRIYPSLEGAADGLLEASLHHVSAAPGFYAGTGPTPATAIEAAFVKLRHALLPEPIEQYLQDTEKDTP